MMTMSKTAVCAAALLLVLAACGAEAGWRRPGGAGYGLNYPELPACQGNNNGRRCLCEKAFYDRDVREGLDHAQRKQASTVIALLDCCEKLADGEVTVNGETCQQVSDICGWNFRPYSNMCSAEACATGRQYDQTVHTQTQQLTCSQYMTSTCWLLPDSTIPEMQVKATCLLGQVTAIVGAVLLGVPSANVQGDSELAATIAPCAPEDHLRRRADGSCNNFLRPWSGMTGGRHLRHSYAIGQNNEDVFLANPVNARSISEVVFKRGASGFRETNLNLNMLAAAWVNFFIHDFFAHEVDWQDVINVPVPHGDDLYDGEPWWTQLFLQVPRHRHSESVSTAGRREYRNRVTAWFDGSQVYGSDDETARSLRTFDGGKLKIAASGLLPDEPKALLESARNRPAGRPATFLSGDFLSRHNNWIGTTFLNNLWVLEHNNVATLLAANAVRANGQPWDDESLYNTARLIVGAEIIKVHTLEWTQQVTDDKGGWFVINSIWDQVGLPFGPTPNGQNTPHLSQDGTYPPNTFDLRWVMTHAVAEDFITAYRWHPMVRDSMQVYDAAGAAVSGDSVDIIDTFMDTSEHRRLGMHSLAQTFGYNKAGDIQRNNVAEKFRTMRHPSLYAEFHSTPLAFEVCSVIRAFDITTADIVREREHAGARYNEQRRILDPLNGMLPSARYFADIVGDDPDKALELAELYDWDIEDVDLLVGGMSEGRIATEGFGITFLTTFLPFVYNRVKLDWFYANGFSADAYSEYGLQRIKGPRLPNGQFNRVALTQFGFPQNSAFHIYGVTLAQIMQETLGLSPNLNPSYPRIFKTWLPAA